MFCITPAKPPTLCTYILHYNWCSWCEPDIFSIVLYYFIDSHIWQFSGNQKLLLFSIWFYCFSYDTKVVKPFSIILIILFIDYYFEPFEWTSPQKSIFTEYSVCLAPCSQSGMRRRYKSESQGWEERDYIVLKRIFKLLSHVGYFRK